MKLNVDVATANEWHVLKGETQYGPYSYEEVIQMTQQKLLYGFEYVWAPHLAAWTSMSELAEFSPDRLQRLIEKSPDADAFNRRKAPRVGVSIPVYCHDNAKFWKGSVENLSIGGCLVLMENPTLLPGDHINLHFRRQKVQQSAFNCTGEILTKRLIKQKIQFDTNIYYAVRFLTMNSIGRELIKTWVEEKLQENKMTATPSPMPQQNAK